MLKLLTSELRDEGRTYPSFQKSGEGVEYNMEYTNKCGHKLKDKWDIHNHAKAMTASDSFYMKELGRSASRRMWLSWPLGVALVRRKAVQGLTFSDHVDGERYALVYPSCRKHIVNALIDAVYPGVADDTLLNECFVERAILAPTNASMRRIDAVRLSGVANEHLLIGSLERVADPNMFKLKYLNSLNFSGIPPQRTVRKVEAPVIMICNLNTKARLYNSTRFRVAPLRAQSIEATIMSDRSRERGCSFRVSSSTIKMTTKTSRVSFDENNVPVTPAFAMTINKA